MSEPPDSPMSESAATRPTPSRSAADRVREWAWSIDRVRLVAAGGVLAALAGFAWWALRPAPVPVPPVELSLPTAAPLPTPAPEPTPSEAVVHVAGAVSSPGLVVVEGGARVADVVAAAGGPTADADLDRVNLAAPVGDGDRVWIPELGDDEVPVVVGGPSSPADEASAVPLDVNTATLDQLDSLPGVGPATAAAIVAERDRVGGFGAVDDLIEVSGIGPAKLEQLRDLVRVGSRP